MHCTRKLALGLATLIGTVGAVACTTAPAFASNANFYVNCTSGSDTATGDSSHPFKTLGHAVSAISGSGNTIHMVNSSNWCVESVTINSKNGTSAAHNKIVGTETGLTKSNRYKAVLAASAGNTALTINSDYWDLSGFTINGQPDYNDNTQTYTTSTSQSTVDSWKDSHQGDFSSTKLLYVGDSHSGTNNLDIGDMWFSDSGGECVRFRENAHDIYFHDNQVQYCGLFKKTLNGYDYHNGEGVYVGTSPKSTGEEGYANDTTNTLEIEGNTIWTWGTECGEFKENEHDNSFSFNTCAHSEEPVASGGSIIEFRGSNNIAFDNAFSNMNGSGSRLAADSGDTADNDSYQDNTWNGYVDAGTTDWLSRGSNVTNEDECGNVATNPTGTFGSGAC